MRRKDSRKSEKGSTLRQRILASVCALIVISLLGSTLSLYRITEVNRVLETINKVSVPLARLFTQIQSDSEIYKRELDHGLAMSHWKDPHWRPRTAPRWIEDVLTGEIERARDLIHSNLDWVAPESRDQWRQWADSIMQGLSEVDTQSTKLVTALVAGNEPQAMEIYPHFNASLEDWRRQVQWGTLEYDHALRQSFSLAQTRVSELRTGLEMVLVVVVSLSLLLLWFGERALRPLAELTGLAREITRRGLRKEDKAILPDLSFSRKDEVSQLAREFHRMATALLEREKMVETQKYKLEEQNKLLREIGELNQNILNSIESVLIVADLSGKITQCNPTAEAWLGKGNQPLIGAQLKDFEKLWGLLRDLPQESRRLEPTPMGDRVYGGHLMALRHSTLASPGDVDGSIIVLDDLTDEVNLQDRLRRAENLAAIGRMSAQVAHEVRNPLHSIGLEAELAMDAASKLGDPELKQALGSILSSVDRLEKITENYLKLSRLSSEKKRIINLGEVLELVLATYASACEAQGVKLDWRREERSNLDVYADPELLEQVLGNLLRNALQALEGTTKPEIQILLGNTEAGGAWIAMKDNGPGISAEIEAKLFTPFVTTRAQGTGLGLSFVKKVIEDHGGTIRSVKRSGPGALFEIILPQAAQSQWAQSEVGDHLHV